MLLAIEAKCFRASDRNPLPSHKQKTQGIVRPDELIALTTAGVTISPPASRRSVNEVFQQLVCPRDTDTIYNAQEQYT